MHLDISAPPAICHKVVPVPIHWRDKVKADIDRDVRLGVLEKVPDNTPVTYLSRMVITAKANGEQLTSRVSIETPPGRPFQWILPSVWHQESHQERRKL